MHCARTIHGYHVLRSFIARSIDQGLREIALVSVEYACYRVGRQSSASRIVFFWLAAPEVWICTTYTWHGMMIECLNDSHRPCARAHSPCENQLRKSNTKHLLKAI